MIALSAAESKTLASRVVVLPAVLGSTNVVIKATPSFFTRGAMALMSAKVSFLADQCTCIRVQDNCMRSGTRFGLVSLFLLTTGDMSIPTGRSPSSQSKKKPHEHNTKAISAVCPECGAIKKSGKPSCCAPGGSWYEACGDAGDPQFHHTWIDGIKACERKSTAR